MKNPKVIIGSIFFLAMLFALAAIGTHAASVKKRDSQRLKSGQEKTLKQVVEKYIAALGGENQIRGVTAKRIRYRVYMGTRKAYDVEQMIQRPGRLRSGRPGEDQYFELEGQKVWRVSGKSRQEFKGPIVGNFKKLADLDGPFIDSVQKGITLIYHGIKKYEFSRLHQVEVVFKDKEKRHYFFDDQSGLPVMMKKPSFLMINNKITRGPTSVYYYFDYREIQGINYPHLWVQTDEDQNHLHVFQVEKITLEKKAGGKD